MRKIYVTIALALFFGVNLSAMADFKIDTARVGKQPAFLFSTADGEFYTFCLGVDANFDGVFDPATDEVPSLWHAVVPIATTIGDITMPEVHIEKVYDFDFGTPGFPLRPLSTGDLLIFHQNGYIKIFDVNHLMFVDSFVYDETVVSLAIWDYKLYVSTRVIPPGAWTPTDNFVNVIDLETRQSIDTIKAKPLVQQVRIPETGKIMILNEGDPGANNSYVSLVSLEKDSLGNHEEIHAFSAGVGGNYFALDQDNVYVVSNGSHKVIKYNRINTYDSLVFNLPTTGYDGPREVVLNPNYDKIRVSAYDGNIYEFYTDGREGMSVFPTMSKVESMLWEPDYFVAANISNADYTENNALTIWRADWQSVAGETGKANIEIYPNPAADIINIKFMGDKYQEYKIYSSLGTLIFSEAIPQFAESCQINIARLNLAAGQYYIRLNNFNEIITVPFTIAK